MYFTCSWRFLISNKSEQLEFKLEKNTGIWKHSGKVRKSHLLTVVESKISTIVVRGSTEHYMDDIERAIDDGVNTYKGIYTVF